MKNEAENVRRDVKHFSRKGGGGTYFIPRFTDKNLEIDVYNSYIFYIFISLQFLLTDFVCLIELFMINKIFNKIVSGF